MTALDMNVRPTDKKELAEWLEAWRKILLRWHVVAAELKKNKEEEMRLRMQIFKYAVPMPKEGTNTADPALCADLGVGNGFVLKAKYPLTRDVDEPVFSSLKESLRSRGINPDILVQYKPVLSVTAYRALTEEDMKFFDQCITIKPGAPALEIMQPKRGVK